MENKSRRIVDFNGLRDYLPFFGRDNSRRFARNAGAEIQIGIKKYYYDLDKVDAALEKMTASHNE